MCRLEGTEVWISGRGGIGVERCRYEVLETHCSFSDTKARWNGALEECSRRKGLEVWRCAAGVATLV